jgi:hypothetical protein
MFVGGGESVLGSYGTKTVVISIRIYAGGNALCITIEEDFEAMARTDAEMYGTGGVEEVDVLIAIAYDISVDGHLFIEYRLVDNRTERTDKDFAVFLLKAEGRNCLIV